VRCMSDKAQRGSGRVQRSSVRLRCGAAQIVLVRRLAGPSSTLDGSQVEAKSCQKTNA